MFLTGLQLQGDGWFRREDSIKGWIYHSAIGIGVAAPTYVSGASGASGRLSFSRLSQSPSPDATWPCLLSGCRIDMHIRRMSTRPYDHPPV